MKSLARIQTEQFISAVIWLAALGGICGTLGMMTRVHSRWVSQFFEAAGVILFCVSYVLLWALLVIAPFRPRSDFSLHGECGIRAVNFLLTLGLLVIMHIYLVMGVILLYVR